MIFLNSLYSQVFHLLAGRINHFPIIRLIFLSLDKTIFYFIIFLIIRYLIKIIKHRKISWRREILVWIFSFYIILLFCLTAFRGSYMPWYWHIYLHRSLSVINIHPIVHTLQLKYAKSPVDYYYNTYGNILWFMPFGMMFPAITHHRMKFLGTAFSGMLMSILIESLQFFLNTGVSDIDDVIFNTIGAIIGYFVYWIFSRL